MMCLTRILTIHGTKNNMKITAWDPVTRNGKYIIMLDNEAFPDDNSAALLELVNEFCDGYLAVNSREYLDRIPEGK
ncbi:hypothetical protein SAMN02910456_02205 [Ruminococcaceae bacterium YRB3002]|nr:hypothetical protein SAMN02910456_02205 [Ruminococcaceae bacterium YRB3002]